MTFAPNTTLRLSPTDFTPFILLTFPCFPEYCQYSRLNLSRRRGRQRHERRAPPGDSGEHNRPPRSCVERRSECDGPFLRIHKERRVERGYTRHGPKARYAQIFSRRYPLRLTVSIRSTTVPADMISISRIQPRRISHILKGAIYLKISVRSSTRYSAHISRVRGMSSLFSPLTATALR